MVQRRTLMYTLQNSGFVLTINGTTLIKRCAGQAERAAILEAGVYRLQLTFPCSLQGKDWALKTTFARESNRTLQADSDLSWIIVSRKCWPTMNLMDLLCNNYKTWIESVGYRYDWVHCFPDSMDQPVSRTVSNGYTSCSCAPSLRRPLPHTSKGDDSSTEATTKELRPKNYVSGNESTKVSVPAPNAGPFVFDNKGCE